MASDGYARDYEDVTIYLLDPERERELVRKQRECTFIWTTSRGESVGVIMSYLETDAGKIWMTASEQRARIAAVRRDPRTCVVISSTGTDMGPGKTVTYRGTTTVHEPSDRKTKDWFYPPFARKLFGFAGEARVRQFIELLDSPRRVILEFTPNSKIVYDGDKMAAATQPADGRSRR